MPASTVTRFRVRLWWNTLLRTGAAVLGQSNESASDVSSRAIIEGVRQIKEDGVKSFFASLVDQLDKEKMMIEAKNNP
jgi:hypothetical protein